jgi:hypothetical protein
MLVTGSIFWENPIMWHHFVNLLARALAQTFPFGGSNVVGALFVGIFGLFTGFAFTCVIEWWRGGRTVSSLIKALKTWPSWAGGILGALFVWLMLFSWQIVSVVYQEHQMWVQKDGQQVIEISGLKDQLRQKEQMLQVGDPAFHNMTNSIRAFMTWRRAIGYDAPCRILVTTPDRDDGGLYMTFITFAVFGSNCPNGDLNNVGVKPEDIERETQKEMLPGVLVFHAPSNAKGANQLATDLSDLFPLKRVYAIPGNPSENTIWIQFGSGMKWKSQWFSRLPK